MVTIREKQHCGWCSKYEHLMGHLSCKQDATRGCHSSHISFTTTVSQWFQTCSHDTSCNGSSVEGNKGSQSWPAPCCHSWPTPIYTIARNIQCNWPATDKEDQFIIILRGIHIGEGGMIGDWLEDSGWVEPLLQANVASLATAGQLFLKIITHHSHEMLTTSNCQ